MAVAKRGPARAASFRHRAIRPVAQTWRGTLDDQVQFPRAPNPSGFLRACRGRAPPAPRPPGAKARSPRATPAANGSATCVPLALRPVQFWQALGGRGGRRARVCRAGIGRGSSGLQGASGWLTFLPRFLWHLTPLTEAGGVNRGGRYQGSRCGPKESQDQSAVSTLARVCRGPGSHRARILCWSNQGLTERPPGLGSEARVSRCVARVPVLPPLWTPCTPSVKCETVICMTPACGEEDRVKRKSLRMSSSLLISTLSPAKPQLWSPKVGGQRGQQVVCEFSPPHFTHPSNQTPFPLQPHFRNFSKEKSSQSHQEMVLLLAILVQMSCN